MKTAFVYFYQINGSSHHVFVAEYKGIVVYDDYSPNTLTMVIDAVAELKRQGFTHVKQKADNKQGFTVKKLG